jgi:hypothetical protein
MNGMEWMNIEAQQREDGELKLLKFVDISFSNSKKFIPNMRLFFSVAAAATSRCASYKLALSSVLLTFALFAMES